MEITREEFYQAVGGLKDDLREDLRNIQARLDVLNGRTGKSEVEIGRLGVRIEKTENDMLRIRRDDNEDAALALLQKRRSVREGQGEVWAETATSTVTTREKGLIGLGLVALTIALKLLELMGTKLWEVMTAHKP